MMTQSIARTLIAFFDMKRFLILWWVLCLVAPLSHAQEPVPPSAKPLTTIASLDLNRYMGVWHEIARYPNWFQEKCAGDTRAEYALQADQTVKVINRCRLKDGRTNEAVGQARLVGATGSARLQVRFAPAWLSFLPFVWGDYWVVDLDPDYSLVAVSEPKREYLWVLARTPQIDEAAYQAMQQRLKQHGFDVSRLLTSAAQLKR